MEDTKTFEDVDYTKQQDVCDEFAGYLKHGSLYQSCPLAALPNKFGEIVPDVLQLDCEGCRRENPFRKVSLSSQAQPEADVGSNSTRFPNTSSESAHKKGLESHVYVIALECKGCNLVQHTFWIYVDKSKSRVRKIGQMPEPSIDVPSDLARALGAGDLKLYKRAKICANQTYGMAACIYLRRILENCITPLLEIIKQNKLEDGADESELHRIQKIIDGKIAEEKIRLISDVIPNSLTVDGDNPLLLSYEELSHGLHIEDEDTCVGLASTVMSTLDRVLVELSSEQEKRKRKTEFETNVRELRRAKTAREKGG